MHLSPWIILKMPRLSAHRKLNALLSLQPDTRQAATSAVWKLCITHAGSALHTIVIRYSSVAIIICADVLLLPIDSLTNHLNITPHSLLCYMNCNGRFLSNCIFYVLTLSTVLPLLFFTPYIDYITMKHSQNYGYSESPCPSVHIDVTRRANQWTSKYLYVLF